METLFLTEKDFEETTKGKKYIGKIRGQYNGDVELSENLGFIELPFYSVRKLIAKKGTNISVGSFEAENIEIEGNIESDNCITVFERLLSKGTVKARNCITANRCIIAETIEAENCVECAGYIKATKIKAGNCIICDFIQAPFKSVGNSICSYKESQEQMSRFYKV